jgi:hypothetical protein
MSTYDDVFAGIQSHALASGLFDQVNTAEPKSAPGSGVSAGIWLQRISPAPGGSGLASTSTRLEIWVRLYTSMLSEPSGAIDPRMLNAAAVLMAAYSGDFTLAVPEVRAVDLLGIYGNPLEGQAGYLEQDGTLYRVFTIALPVIVNDAFTQAA